MLLTWLSPKLENKHSDLIACSCFPKKLRKTDPNFHFTHWIETAIGFYQRPFLSGNFWSWKSEFVMISCIWILLYLKRIRSKPNKPIFSKLNHLILYMAIIFWIEHIGSQCVLKIWSFKNKQTDKIKCWDQGRKLPLVFVIIRKPFTQCGQMQLFAGNSLSYLKCIQTRLIFR